MEQHHTVTGANDPAPQASARVAITRRRFLASLATAGLTVSLGAPLMAASQARAARPKSHPSPTPPMPKPATGTAAQLGHLPLRFFNDHQARTVAAMAERIFPADAHSPGATDARVVDYIDGQLAGGWGVGDKTYLQGPFFVPADPFHGWQYPLTPRDIYTRALQALDNYLGGRDFASLPNSTQDAILEDMEAGKIPMTPPSNVFFAMFLENVKEGLFADPIYGGNRNLIGWKWINFPGDPMAYGDPYWQFIDNFQVLYNVAPKSLADQPY